jgi:hypothetical protein
VQRDINAHTGPANAPKEPCAKGRDLCLARGDIGEDAMLECAWMTKGSASEIAASTPRFSGLR